MKDLVRFPNNILYLKSEPVTEFGSSLKQAVEEMVYVMRNIGDRGIGITAVQCGILKRMAILDLDPKGKQPPIIICNPVVLDQEGANILREGCLSFPGKFTRIMRPQIIRVKYQNGEGQERVRFFHDIWARCMLHEIDHMDGILFIDRAKEQGRQLEFSMEESNEPQS